MHLLEPTTYRTLLMIFANKPFRQRKSELKFHKMNLSSRELAQAFQKGGFSVSKIRPVGKHAFYKSKFFRAKFQKTFDENGTKAIFNPLLETFFFLIGSFPPILQHICSWCPEDMIMKINRNSRLKLPENVRPLYVIDNTSGTGNGFFQTLATPRSPFHSLDSLCIPYSLLNSVTRQRSTLAKLMTSGRKILLRLLYSDKRWRLQISSPFWRRWHIKSGDDQDYFDQLVLQKNTICRKDVIFASFFAIARAFNKDISKIKYLILTDSISLRKENLFRGFSGKIIDISIKDSSKARFIHLVRDPRAGFASTNHQFVNQLGNTYAIRLGNIPQRFMELLRCEFSMEGPFVFGFWILYFLETFRSIEKKKEERPDRFLTIRNEDLNLRFVPTIKKLPKTLNWTSFGFGKTLTIALLCWDRNGKGQEVIAIVTK